MSGAQCWRIYYDGKDQRGKHWMSVDNDDIQSEIKVAFVALETSARSNVAAPFPFGNIGHLPVPLPGEPSAWMETFGVAEFENGGVVIRPSEVKG